MTPPMGLTRTGGRPPTDGGRGLALGIPPITAPGGIERLVTCGVPVSGRTSPSATNRPGDRVIGVAPVGIGKSGDWDGAKGEAREPV
jgi:hypothetical protein